MAELSPHHVVINDKSVDESKSTDVNASHQEPSNAAQGLLQQSTTQQLPPPPQLDASPLDSISSQEHAQPNGTVNREIDNATPDQHGSDTDSSRPDGSKVARSGSATVKKPLSFKPVSITKSFLAKTATTPGNTPPPVKIAEKPSPQLATLQLNAKPRLIAKTGSSGLRDVPHARPGDGASTPNGRTVWNKNQPAPPVPAKHYTDEELKQKYGIHLATRLESEEATEQKAKWADIDEDEEEWTPETVEWMDGTKTTISHTEAAIPQPQEKPVEKLQEELPPTTTSASSAPSTAPVKPVMTALKRTNVAPQSRTILRPGAAQQAKQIGADGKATPDSKSPMLKNSATAPVKSPWAPLPPVEKASPITVNPPPASQAPPRFSHRDNHGFDAMAQPPPTREMATDTFDRSWKDGERSNRELFNSQSGRYEPAPEHRRGSRQQDQHHRQPAVLQRPTPGSGSAEPSAAFQARTSSQTDASPWGRRRGSSISGNMLRDRRMSSSSKVFDPSEPSPEAAPEANVEAQPSAEASEQPSHQTDGPAPSALSITEEREKQKKLMQEKREAAIRRRQEEEAREEAERRERIRKKMEALGMPLEKTPSQEPSEKVESKQPEAPKQTDAPSASATSASPEKPPAVEPASLEKEPSSTEAHVSPPVKQLSPRKEKVAEPSLPFTQNSTPITRPAHKTLSSPQLPGLQQLSPNGPTRSSYQQSTLQGMNSSFSSPGDQNAQPARLSSISGGDAFTATPWGNASMTSHTAPALWGPPPTNNRHIGNGTFDAGYSSISPNSRAQSQNAPFTAPFGRPYSSRVSPKAFGQQASAQPGSMDQQYNSLSTLEPRLPEPIGAAALAGTSPLPEPARLAYPAPIAPPQKAAPRQQTLRDTSAWTNFSNNAQTAREDAQTAARLENERAKPSMPRQSHHAQTGWTVTETFKQTHPGENRWLEGETPTRSVAKTQEIARGTIHGPHRAGAIGAARLGPHRNNQAAQAPRPSIAQQSMHHPPPSSGEQLHMGGEGIVRLPTGPSSFSRPAYGSPGNTTTGVKLPPLSAYASNAQLSPLPVQPSTPGLPPQQSRFFPSALYGGSPPPEEADHPVYGGDSKHPHVNLPTPKPKVKLPPAAVVEREQLSPTTMSRSVHPYTVGARPLVQTSDWQARFNGLFGKAQVMTTTPPSPPKTPPKAQAPAPAVASVSRTSSDSVIAESATTVSLPRSNSPVSTYTKIVSKPGVDDIFDGELSFGSTPRVFLPRGVTYPEAPATASTPVRANSRFHKPVDSQSKRILFFPDSTKHDITVNIKLPLPWFVTRKVTLECKNPAAQSRKNSNRPNNKNKRYESSNAVTETPDTAVPAATGAVPGKPHNITVAAEKGTKTPLTENTVASNSNTENVASKKTVWAKVPKVPRGRGRGSYRAQA
ncbi:hypothetical protein AUEXF2481DRAFT_505 [Aureobasidium subglaciale EXF-2481]|uniref:Uncharacterized protein n=1 Tax=Aureobasidium subglaciale (strain EXF-2481) TaxID=1043005 RepID=A0A074ZQM7_AURSE|nr:uncharacterized protein AUEXF2481DRAFT_505 [Aureobasidium subglaciale EXF-2481]KAI5199454.1 hypothetical protein E4T38_07011 [Aureobasidium subglaciale]KAI5218353.1 hypothetical protein E4T40_06942 [Aureobasidium subglaciale]KAI5221932.1 hypothetical protein E4T41_06862 [Aureobasidium subglaciale]KAI5259238.1 hypothetical protein E4T46_06840 [Aureobasidium subglaciale]KER00587.1 hypothetical protein AUEXF2481DRAFT_505 [Aureobasidium subglaciale EXF-2481]